MTAEKSSGMNWLMFNIGSCPGYMMVYSQRVVVHVLVEIQNDLYHRSHWTVGKLEISDPVHFQKVSNLCLFLFRIFQHLFGHRHWVGSHDECAKWLEKWCNMQQTKHPKRQKLQSVTRPKFRSQSQLLYAGHRSWRPGRTRVQSIQVRIKVI